VNSELSVKTPNAHDKFSQNRFVALWVVTNISKKT